MNDLEILRNAWPAPHPPSAAAHDRARAALLARAVHGPAPRSRRVSRRRIALAAAAAALVAVAVVVPTGHRTVPTAAAQALHRAAQSVAQQPFTAPRHDQWIYTEDSIGGRPARQTWRRADGRGFAMRDERGHLQVELMRPRPGRTVPSVFDSYVAIVQLPRDPDALLRWADAETDNVSGAGSSRDAEAFNILRGLLGAGVLPPDLRATIFRAIAQVPAVTVRTVDGMLGVGLTDEWLRQEILLDPKTYTYRGQRSVVIKDTRINPLKAGNATGEVHKGSTVVSMRTAQGVVDKPGELP